MSATVPAPDNAPGTPAAMVTVVIEHLPVPGAAAAYEAWLARIIPVAATFPGHRGTHVLRPQGAEGQYTVTLRFDDVESASHWLASSVRRGLLAEVAPLLTGSEKVRTVTGMEFWFTAPPGSARTAPAYKQFLVAWSVIYPLTFAVPWLLRPLLQSLADWPLIAHLVDTGAVVFVMTFVIMPHYTRLVARWLFH
jgi:antibiotic biosynthesis monooxygenase (ABM) superfamily enzyme